MEIENNVDEIIFNLCGIDIFECNDSLKNDLGLDSLDMVTLLIEIEDKFNIELNGSDIDPSTLILVSDVYNLVAKYRE